MSYVTPIGSFRDATPNRSILSGGIIAGSTSVSVQPDGARAAFYPQQGAIHTIAVLAANVTWTITDATVPLPYDLKIGEGFMFSIQNNGASLLTLAVAGVDANGKGTRVGAGTLTVPTARTRIFALTRVSEFVHQLDTLGVLTQ